MFEQRPLPSYVELRRSKLGETAAVDTTVLLIVCLLYTSDAADDL